MGPIWASKRTWRYHYLYGWKGESMKCIYISDYAYFGVTPGERPYIRSFGPPALLLYKVYYAKQVLPYSAFLSNPYPTAKRQQYASRNIYFFHTKRRAAMILLGGTQTLTQALPKICTDPYLVSPEQTAGPTSLQPRLPNHDVSSNTPYNHVPCRHEQLPEA